jgi:L-methionine (R)-S-oxide reductase
MAEELHLPATEDKAEKYAALLPQLRSLIDGEPDLIANLANVTAALKEAFGFFWVGWYLMKGGELVLGPFQGPLACTRIALGKGVCGTAAARRTTIVVEDVELFPGHIACSSLSRSEIVVPMVHHDTVLGVLDVDSERLAEFDAIDQFWLEQVVADLVAQHWPLTTEA